MNSHWLKHMHAELEPEPEPGSQQTLNSSLILLGKNHKLVLQKMFCMRTRQKPEKQHMRE